MKKASTDIRVRFPDQSKEKYPRQTLRPMTDEEKEAFIAELKAEKAKPPVDMEEKIEQAANNELI